MKHSLFMSLLRWLTHYYLECVTIHHMAEVGKPTKTIPERLEHMVRAQRVEACRGVLDMDRAEYLIKARPTTSAVANMVINKDTEEQAAPVEAKTPETMKVVTIEGGQTTIKEVVSESSNEEDKVKAIYAAAELTDEQKETNERLDCSEHPTCACTGKCRLAAPEDPDKVKNPTKQDNMEALARAVQTKDVGNYKND